MWDYILLELSTYETNKTKWAINTWCSHGSVKGKKKYYYWKNFVKFSPTWNHVMKTMIKTN